MSRVSHFLFFLISRVLLLSLAQGEETKPKPECEPLSCGVLGDIQFPFSNETYPDCGLLMVEGCNEQVQTIQLDKDWPRLYITGISQDNTLELRDELGSSEYSNSHSCNDSLKNLTLSSPFISFELSINQTLFKCPRYTIPEDFVSSCNDSQHSIIYYNGTSHNISDISSKLSPGCSNIQFRKNKNQKGIDFKNLFTGWFQLQVNVTKECHDCHKRRGQCQIDDNGKFRCLNATKGGKGGKLSSKRSLGLGIGIGGSTVLMVVLCIWFIRRRKKQKYISPRFHSRYTSSDPSSNSELEVGYVYFGVPVFSYSELAEATNNFSQENELGDGGFGTVYYAKLHDGREVAIKHLYEHNYRRLEQFMNEVEILTRLHHKNLVSLYGCTSRHSQHGLLLVYEYIPNGTLADHLHGDRAKPGSLTWPIRLTIAIETACALAYLHASDIIHRDVKTHNILLDNNFCVKVADFGLSRTFRTNVTHVSTAPQGSPGYVDPEYHQFYQLTDKSDVYSFGVVLIELISSLPAVDITRHRDEINLSNLAIKKIQNRVIDELIDPSLGYQSDEEVKRMTTSVAELAFLCLQQNKEMRPSMGLVLEELKRIESGESKLENRKEELNGNDVLKSMQPPPDSDDLAFLKHIQVPFSPISVTAKWISSDTTSNVSF